MVRLHAGNLRIMTKVSWDLANNHMRSGQRGQICPCDSLAGSVKDLAPRINSCFEAPFGHEGKKSQNERENKSNQNLCAQGDLRKQI